MTQEQITASRAAYLLGVGHSTFDGLVWRGPGPAPPGKLQILARVGARKDAMRVFGADEVEQLRLWRLAHPVKIGGQSRRWSRT